MQRGREESSEGVRNQANLATCVCFFVFCNHAGETVCVPVCVSLFYVIGTGSTGSRPGPNWGLLVYPFTLALTLATPIYLRA
jgi:hypothetical protein